MNVGQSIQAAISRAKQHERAMSTWKLRVHFATQWGELVSEGIHIVASVPASSTEEYAARKHLAHRMVLWEELDERAGELTAIVETVVAEVLAAVGGKPSG